MTLQETLQPKLGEPRELFSFDVPLELWDDCAGQEDGYMLGLTSLDVKLSVSKKTREKI